MLHPVALTILADVFYSVSIILMVVCLAVGNAKPTSNFSWSLTLHTSSRGGRSGRRPYRENEEVGDCCVPIDWRRLTSLVMC